MSRSGYVDDLEDYILNLYRGRVARTIKGKRGQAFLRELATAMDAMPEKVLIADDLINEDGDCCAIGVVCKSRGINVSIVDPHQADEVGAAVDISPTMAAEIEYENDEGWYGKPETPEERWQRMRRWVGRHILTNEPESGN